MFDGRRLRVVCCGALLFGLGCGSPAPVVIGADKCQSPGVHELQLTALGPTDRSHWLQPWRAYMDTWPAAKVRGAIGFSAGENIRRNRLPLLARMGVARANTVIQWNEQDFDDLTKLGSGGRDDVRATCKALRAVGIRPLFLLYGFVGTPGPAKSLKLKVIEAAPKGSRVVKLDPTMLSSIKPHYTGFSGLTGFRAAEVLITSVDAATGVATLSKPLPKDLPLGLADGATLRFRPFSRPVGSDGQPNPLFEETLEGWLHYVKAVSREAQATLGDSEFDIELWNETFSGGDFLDINNYYDPPFDPEPRGPLDINLAIVDRTLRMLRDPGSGVGPIGVGNGFANTEWSLASSNQPASITALNRHVSTQGVDFPQDATRDESRPLGPRGTVVGAQQANGGWIDNFIPKYGAFFPELPLTAIQAFKTAKRPGQLIRDLAPLVTLDANGVGHGRRMGMQNWVTSINTHPRPDKSSPAGVTDADIKHFAAKVALRTVASYVGKGADAIFFYENGTNIQIIDDNDVATGGEALRALGRFRSAFDGPATINRLRPLRLRTVRGCAGGRQFEGDGSPEHPPLLNRDVVGFFPFQVDEKRWVVPTYVMTRDLMALQRPGVGRDDVARYDLPPETYDLVIEGVDGERVLVEATDPLQNVNVEITVKTREKNLVVVAMPLTDSVRLLRLTEP